MRTINNFKYTCLILFIIIVQFFLILEKKVNFDKNIFFNSFKKSFGSEYALTKGIIELKKFLKLEKINNFEMSLYLQKNTYFYQRTVEYFFPIKISESSNTKIYDISEKNLPNCKKIIIEEFYIVKC
jgi:hypothetical protein